MAVELLEAGARRRHRTRSAVDHGREHVIVQVAPDTRKVGDDIDSCDRLGACPNELFAEGVVAAWRVASTRRSRSSGE
jgi:hypothetical protein